MSATWYSDQQKERTDERVLAALEKGKLSQSQIAEAAGVSATGVFHSIQRLLDEGYVRETGVRIRTTNRSGGATMAMTYELGNPREVSQKTVKQWQDKPFRDWRDTALFGDYVPAKNPASTRAEAA
jgi:DNA-binding Lrp family transcriptional regulator